MVAPEHLNWHKDMEEYVAAKTQLTNHQTSEDTAIFYAANDLSRQVVAASPGHILPYYAAPGAAIDDGVVTIDGHAVCRTDELLLLGQHNWQNVCAAVTTVWQVSHDVQAIRSVLTSFSGLPHRLELVREVDGVKYYDDSFGTTPETAIVALQAFEQPKVIILGGSDKGANYDELSKTVVASNVRAVILIGQQADRIQAALERAGFSAYQPGGDSMASIVEAAGDAAEPGDIVLLSTGCASFGMFKNYKDRAAQFIQAVQALA
jgi:UDP-N-acetylmuramoylalanine--D-glutamate ligase